MCRFFHGLTKAAYEDCERIKTGLFSFSKQQKEIHQGDFNSDHRQPLAPLLSHTRVFCSLIFALNNEAGCYSCREGWVLLGAPAAFPLPPEFCLLKQAVFVDAQAGESASLYTASFQSGALLVQ